MDDDNYINGAVLSFVELYEMLTERSKFFHEKLF